MKKQKISSPGFFPLAAGTELNNRYLIAKTIGRGSFGTVYLAQDLETKKIAAVKEYFPDNIVVRNRDNITVEALTSEQTEAFTDGTEKFISEAELLSRLNCKGIPEVYDVFRANNTAYYVMEYANGTNLRSYIDKNGALSQAETLYLISSLAETLKTLHENHILHRDISPENIMLCNGGDIKLIDFGAARPFIDDKTSEMSVILKYGFAPPEQYRRKTVKGPCTDIYSVGTVAFYAATGLIPDDAFSRLDDDSEFDKACSSLSEPVKAIISKAADTEYEKRYQTADELLCDAKNCGIKPEKITIGLSDIPEIRISFKKRRKKLALIISAAVVVLAAVISVFVPASENEIPSELRIGDEYFPVDSEVLDLSERELTNNQIANLKHFKNLKSLTLDDNYLTDLSDLKKLTGLKELYFSNNNVSDISFLEDINGLEKLTAVNNSIEDISVLADMTELRNLYLQDNFITDISALENLNKLKYIGFDENQLKTIAPLSDKAELKQVCFSGCNLTDISPLASCPRLEQVYLGRNKVTDFSPLKGKYIKELILDNNNLDENSIKTLYGLNVLYYVDATANNLTEAQAYALADEITGGAEVYY